MRTRLVVFALLAIVYAVPLNAQVIQEWVARYNGPGNLADQANALTVDGSGYVYVTGQSVGSGVTGDYATLKYDASGNQLWLMRYDGPGNSYDYAHAIAVDGNGNTYVTGESEGGATTGDDYATIKYAASGTQLWVARYNGPIGSGADMASALALDGSGNVYVTGRSMGLSMNVDYATVKYNSAGAQLWAMRYDGPMNWYDYANAIAVDGGGNVYVTGRSSASGTGFDYATIKYSTSGSQLWAARYNGPGNGEDNAVAIAVDANGNCYVTGYSLGTGPYNDYLTIKYSASGVQLWTARYNGPGNQEDRANAIAIDGSGNVYVTGRSALNATFPYNDDYTTVKYDASGNQLWVARYDGPANSTDEAYALALDSQNNVYVAGYSFSDSSSGDYATIKYNPAGIQLWVQRYNGPGNAEDFAYGLAVNGSNVYVTGKSYGNGTNYDYATIKYSPTQLDVTLTPLNPPIIVPATGGSFSFNVSIQRVVGPAAPYTVWARIKNPDGSYTLPTLGPVTVNTPVGLLVTRTRNQSVPGTWAAGLYTYLGYANASFSYPAMDSSSFTWTKSATADGAPWISDAICSGETFPGEVAVSAPVTISFMNAHPSPFNPSTTIFYSLPQASKVRLSVFDAQGRTVAVLVEGWREAGTHEVTFDGSQLSSGLYFYRLTDGSHSATGKMVLLK
jgi:hypothetical protein